MLIQMGTKQLNKQVVILCPSLKERENYREKWTRSTGRTGIMAQAAEEVVERHVSRAIILT